jgi:hypothetical protein
LPAQNIRRSVFAGAPWSRQACRLAYQE